MRLLNVNSIEFAEFRDNETPPYAIASHRWVGCEAKFKDVLEGRNRDQAGFKKVEAFAAYIKQSALPLEWLWIDTCCINKDSAAELSEAINLMFDWYRSADLCIAYLADVEVANDKSRFKKSKWFKRGWTLQELLAPRLVVFVTKSWQVIGNTGASTHNARGTPAGPSLERDVAEITGIPEQALHHFESSQGWSVEERLSWIEGRTTTREEDMSYALYGIFGVSPGANYGEKRGGARQRLMAAINHQKDVAAQQADRFRKIAEWLSPPDPWTNHHSARQRHEPQTGTWLLDCDDYRHWKSASIRHLWIHGKAGCGKTVLCSTAIEDVKAHCENGFNAGYAVFYFSFSDDQKQRYEDLILSLVVQLGRREPGLSVLQQAYEKPQSKPGQDDLEKILLSCIASYDEIFVILDALDESPEAGDVRQGILTRLARLGRKAPPQLKILVTSRKLPDIGASMAAMGAVPIPVATRAVDADIQRYIVKQLSGDHRLSRLDQTTKALIKETISAKADGMFRWVHCQLQELKKLRSTRPSFVKEKLYSLPATLDETYERMLVEIEPGLRTDALTLLRWLAYAKSPPSLDELVDATVIDVTAEGKVELEDRPGLDDALEILSGLVTVIGGEENEDDRYRIDFGSEGEQIKLARPHQQISGDAKVRLAHFSVKEYLESKRILESSAKDFYLESTRGHGVLSQSCLECLVHYTSSDEKLSTRRDFATFPLLRYAAKTWFYHSALQGDTKATREVGLLSTDATLRSWLRVHQPDHEPHLAFLQLDDIGSSLYYASFLGLEQVVRELLSTGANANVQGGHLGNALQAASSEGHEIAVQILTHAGADVNAQGGACGNALQAASFQGDEKVVQMLIDAGADVNAQGGFLNNALQAALDTGYEQVVQMAIDAGADVNAYGDKVLPEASKHGREKVVQILVDAGADVNAQSGRVHSSALMEASPEGNEKIVQILIDAEADVDAQEVDHQGRYIFALKKAARRPTRRWCR